MPARRCAPHENKAIRCRLKFYFLLNLLYRKTSRLHKGSKMNGRTTDWCSLFRIVLFGFSSSRRKINYSWPFVVHLSPVELETPPEIVVTIEGCEPLFSGTRILTQSTGESVVDLLEWLKLSFELLSACCNRLRYLPSSSWEQKENYSAVSLFSERVKIVWQREINWPFTGSENGEWTSKRWRGSWKWFRIFLPYFRKLFSGL